MDWNMSNASPVAVLKPCFSSVPTGSNIRTSAGAMVRQDAIHSSRWPAFHNSACFAAWANRAWRLGTALIFGILISDPRRALGRSRLVLEGWPVEPVPGGEFLDRSAAELAQLPCGRTERKKGGDRMGVGDAEEVADLLLFGDGHRGRSAAVPL